MTCMVSMCNPHSPSCSLINGWTLGSTEMSIWFENWNIMCNTTKYLHKQISTIVAKLSYCLMFSAIR